jgi:FtsH-binding integral membrane protein
MMHGKSKQWQLRELMEKASYFRGIDAYLDFTNIFLMLLRLQVTGEIMINLFHVI